MKLYKNSIRLAKNFMKTDFTQNLIESPPCTMGKRFCLSGRLCASMHLSSQRTVLWRASSKRAGSVCVVSTTSSSCIIMSAPIAVCNGKGTNSTQILLWIAVSRIQFTKCQACAILYLQEVKEKGLTVCTVSGQSH